MIRLKLLAWFRFKKKNTFFLQAPYLNYITAQEGEEGQENLLPIVTEGVGGPLFMYVIFGNLQMKQLTVIVQKFRMNSS